MLTDAFENPKAGVSLSDTISDALKDYPAASGSSRGRSVLSKMQCFRPSQSFRSPNKAELRKQLEETHDQYQQLSYQNRHAETALSGSISDTLRLDRDKNIAEAQAAQARQELRQLQQALQESEGRIAASGQQVQRELQLLRSRVRGLTHQTHRVSSHLQTVQGGSIAQLMDTAWAGGTGQTANSTSPDFSEALVDLEGLHRDIDQAQQQMALLETMVQSKALNQWTAQQEFHAQLLQLQSQDWWGPQLVKGSAGLGAAYIGSVWWITKGVTRLCLIPIQVPASIVQRVCDIATRDHQTIMLEPIPEGLTDSSNSKATIPPEGPQNPMLGKAIDIEEDFRLTQ